MRSRVSLLKVGALLLAGTFLLTQTALAAGAFQGLPLAGSSTYPSTIPLSGNETIPADTGLTQGANPATELLSPAQIAAYGNSQANRNNALIGGDASTNLWQRGTTGASETTTVAYGGADRWAYWSGASTAVTVSRSNTAAALPSGYQQTFRMQRTAGQTGVVQTCFAQEVSSANSYQFQGSSAEFDFHAYLGANYSGGTSLTAYIITGTGADEGMSSLAFGLNAGGGGGAGWTGQANATAAVIPLSTVSTGGRYAAVAAIPATATEIAVAVCYTPSGTAGTTDAVYLAGLQLARNNANAAYNSATVGYSCATIACMGFERRSAQTEAALQYQYYWQWAETASTTAGSPFMCEAQSSTVAICLTVPPVTMFKTPTIACTAGTLKRQVAGTDTTVSACAATATTNGISSVGSVSVTATVASGDTAGFSSVLMSGNSTGGGLITATAEL